MEFAFNAAGTRIGATDTVEALHRAGLPATAFLARCECCGDFVRLVQRFGVWAWEHHPVTHREPTPSPPKSKRKPRPNAAHRIACPKCWAGPGFPCKGRTGRNNRAATHVERTRLWRRRCGELWIIQQRTGDFRLLPTDEAIAALRAIEASRFVSITTSEPNANGETE